VSSIARHRNEFIDGILEVIQQEVRKEVDRGIEAQVEAFRQRLVDQADLMAMRVMQVYDTHIDRDRVVIRVEKLQNEKTPTT
jgi:hypothetical protein